MLHRYNTTDDVIAFSTTRHGGVSIGNYASFNANHYCGDNPENVRTNRGLLCKELNIAESNLIVPHQTHDTRTLVIDNEFLARPTEEQKERLEGIDAICTNLKDVCVCVSTADCIPVLIYDPVNHIVSAIHAGWRGTVQRIVEANIKVLTETFGTKAEDCHAIIGPGISLNAFEIGDEVYEAFDNAGFDMTSIAKRYHSSTEPKKTKWHINLPLCNKIQLMQSGIKEEKIHNSGICTFSTQDVFFSARRLGIKSGRILNGILMTSNN